MQEKTLESGFTVRGEERDSLWGSVQEIWRFRPLIAELVRRDLKVRYKNRVGGVLWSLFPPLMQVLTITLMVKLFLSPVNNYSAYLMPVMFLWQFFQNTVLDASNSMLVNSALARKIYFPRAVLPIVTVISNLMHFGIALAFIFAYFFLMPISDPIYPKNLRIEFLWIIPITLLVAVLALGLGYLLAYLTTLYDDVKFLNVTFLGLFFYALPILYPIERVAAQPQIFPIYMLNPMAALLVSFQRVLLPPIEVQGTTPMGVPYNWLIIATITSIAIFLLGFYVFERSKWTMMERL